MIFTIILLLGERGKTFQHPFNLHFSFVFYYFNLVSLVWVKELKGMKGDRAERSYLGRRKDWKKVGKENINGKVKGETAK